jgi:hypothetical protein
MGRANRRRKIEQDLHRMLHLGVDTDERLATAARRIEEAEAILRRLAGPRVA